MDWSGFRPPADWRQSGGEWAGPCPVSGAGKTKAWANPDADLLGCRDCSPGGLRGELLRQHAAVLGVVLVGSGSGAPVWPSRSTRQTSLPAAVEPVKRRGDGGAAAGALWSVAVPVPELGAGYLAGRGAWSPPGSLPGSVRWVPAAVYFAAGAYPGIPVEAAGALVYRFMAPDDGDATRAVQVEAIDPAGRRLTGWQCWDRDARAWSIRDMKRPSVRGSDFGSGRRVFVGRWAAAPAEVWIVEGPVDALALTDHCRRHRPDAAVLGVAGTSGFKLPAVEAAPADAVIVVGADDDDGHPTKGKAAAVRLGAELERAGRRWEVRTAPAGDWCDWAIESAERMATRDA